MYYPLLRARQFELIALRELAAIGAIQDSVIPILEPVRKTQNNLDLAHAVFREQQQPAYLIVNPEEGDLNGDHDVLLEYRAGLEGSVFLPAFYYKDNADYIHHSIDSYGLRDCMLIGHSDVSTGDEGFQDLLLMPEISAITVEDPERNRGLSRPLKKTDKRIIRLDDLFEKKERNSDYLSIPEHRFTEEHLFYDDEGYSGFSDYTVLPSEYSDSGSTPRAVVIHFTYLDEKNQIWIRHFTSDSNDSIANVQGKFAEAAEKTVQYCRERGLTNPAIQELEKHFTEQHYPGLGTIKKISLKNHLLVVSQYLQNR